MRVFRKVWHFVYDPVGPSRPAPDTVELSQESKRNVVVADVIDGPDSPFEQPAWNRSPSISSVKVRIHIHQLRDVRTNVSHKPNHPPREPHSYEPSPYARRRSTYIPVVSTRTGSCHTSLKPLCMQDGEDDELKDDLDASNTDLPPLASGSTPYVPTKRKASSSRAGKQKR